MLAVLAEEHLRGVEHLVVDLETADGALEVERLVLLAVATDEDAERGLIGVVNRRVRRFKICSLKDTNNLTSMNLISKLLSGSHGVIDDDVTLL